jgi:hypothetical protein
MKLTTQLNLLLRLQVSGQIPSLLWFAFRYFKKGFLDSSEPVICFLVYSGPLFVIPNLPNPRLYLAV